MRPRSRWVRHVVLWLFAMVGPALPLTAAEVDAEAKLSDEQAAIARRYKDLETVLQRMSDLMRRSDPDRAQLAGKAFSRSKKDLVGTQLDQVVESLRSGELSGAIKAQQAVREDMAALLELLLSEDKARQLKERRERTEKYLKEVRDLQSRQKSLRAMTERSATPDGRSLIAPQSDLARQAKELAARISRDDQKAGSDAEKPSGTNGQPNSANGDKGNSGGKSENMPAKGAEASGSPDLSDPATPGRMDLQQAEKAMEQARQELEQLKKQPASRAQDEAIRHLEKVIEKLEEILRQLREEERQERLASLESRFRKMLEQEKIILEGTERLNAVSPERRTRADAQKSVALAKRQGSVTLDAEQALMLLREDGTAIAFPESVEALRNDSQRVAGRLDQALIDPFTVSMEQDIIESLEEMVASLQRQMKEGDKAGKSGKSGEPGKTPLVDQLGELKMIRSLQHRVNTRTTRLASLEGKTPAEQSEKEKAVADLAVQQARIYRITRDVVLGKNQ